MDLKKQNSTDQLMGLYLRKYQRSLAFSFVVSSTECKGWIIRRNAVGNRHGPIARVKRIGRTNQPHVQVEHLGYARGDIVR